MDNDGKIRDLIQKLTHRSNWPRLEQELLDRRLLWVKNKRVLLWHLQGTDLEKAYRLLILKLAIPAEKVKILKHTKDKIVFRSQNFCPTLEACKILGLDTREVCRKIYERPTDALVKTINPNLKFGRNYRCIRPYANYCEEYILLRGG